MILSNREDTRPAALAAAIMDEAIGERFPRPYPGRDADPRLAKNGPTAAQLAAVPGVYVDSETDEWVTLRVEGGVLVGDTLGDPFFLYPEGDGVFRDGEDYQATVPVELRMEFGPSDRDVTGRVNLGGQRITLRKSSPPAYAPAALGGFEGRYESAEIASRHSIRVESGRLLIAYGPGWNHGRVFPMEPIARGRVPRPARRARHRVPARLPLSPGPRGSRGERERDDGALEGRQPPALPARVDSLAGGRHGPPRPVPLLPHQHLVEADRAALRTRPTST